MINNNLKISTGANRLHTPAKVAKGPNISPMPNAILQTMRSQPSIDLKKKKTLGSTIRVISTQPNVQNNAFRIQAIAPPPLMTPVAQNPVVPVAVQNPVIPTPQVAPIINPVGVKQIPVANSPQCAEFEKSIKEGGNFPANSPVAPIGNETLYDTISKVATVITDQKLGTVNIGTNYGNIGGDQVKGMNVNFRIKPMKGHNFVEVNFKVTHFARKSLEKKYDALAVNVANLSTFLQKIGLATNVKFLRENFIYSSLIGSEYVFDNLSTEFGKTKVADFGDLGRIQFGADQTYTAIYNRVRLILPASCTAHKLHKLFCLFDLNQVLSPSTPHQILRIKMGTLFRTFFPVTGTKLERTAKYFMLPPIDSSKPHDLKREMILLEPTAAGLFDKELPSMKQEDISLGYLRWTIPSIAHKARNLGAICLFSELTTIFVKQSTPADINNECEVIAGIMNVSPKSSEERAASGVMAMGLSSEIDHITGGSDSVFTRILVNNLGQDLNNKGIFFLYTLDLLNTSTYQYHEDVFGTREEVCYFKQHNGSYYTRDNIIDFIRTEGLTPNFKNEVMIKAGVRPDDVVGVVTPNQQWSDGLKHSLRQRGMLSLKNGREYYHSIPLDEFIHISGALNVAKIKKYT